jgi:hypothetical protein
MPRRDIRKERPVLGVGLTSGMGFIMSEKWAFPGTLGDTRPGNESACRANGMAGRIFRVGQGRQVSYGEIFQSGFD